MIQKPQLSIPIVRQCNDFEKFTELMDQSKYSVKEIFFNGKKHDKRKTNFEDFEDIFDNDVSVKYFYSKNRLDVWVGDYYHVGKEMIRY
jgi:CRISPR/Cas system CSM-associated protein Csm2 small subunit